jgi:DNA-binding response OmpR family regulator
VPAALEASRMAPRVDLLATDICLPGGDGIELALRLRDARPGLPALFMSGLEAERALSRLPWDGTWAFLPKPFTSRDLDARLAELLGPGMPSGPARRG